MNKKIDTIRSYLKIDKLKNDKRAVVFLICLFIASSLWFLNALNKNYTTTVSYPVRFVGAPNHQFLSNDPPSKLELKVDAHGFTLLRHKLSLSFRPIILNLSNITRNITPDKGTYYIQSASLLRRVSSQVSKEITISEILPEVFAIVLDSLKTKEVEVKPDLDIGFQTQFNLKSPIQIQPGSVKITGPASVIDTIQSLSTERIELKAIDASLEKSLKVLHSKNTTLVPAQVMLKVDVEKFTEKEIVIPIQIKNKPSNVNIKLFPSEVKLICLVGLSEFDALNAENFEVVIDYESIRSGSNNLAVEIANSPSFVELIRFTPESVEYLIETN